MSAAGREVALVGVGYSEINRHGGPSKERLTIQATRNAINDAGISASEIDGMFTYRFPDEGDAPPAHWTMKALGVGDVSVWMELYPAAPSGVAPVLAAVQSVASGTCEMALVYRCMTTEGAVQLMKPLEAYVDAPLQAQWSAPFGVGNRSGAVQDAAFRMRRRMTDYGATREDFGQIALNARRWAANNERAVLRSPLTMDDYLNVRMIMEPFCLFDADYPVSGCTALVVTTADRAKDMAKKPVFVDSWSYGTEAPDAPERERTQFGGMIPCVKRLWQNSSFTVDDMDVAELYDGFSYITVSWIEALGFCGYGEFPDWVENGKTIGPGGRVPVNTHGGMFTEGRLHGLPFVTEAVLQLRGECGVRQVPNAATAVIGSAYNILSGAMVLRT